MAVTLTEKAQSREVSRGANDTETLLFSARGSGEEEEVYAAVVAGSPAMVNGLVRQNITLRPVGDDDLWDVEVEFGTRGEDGTGNPLGVPSSDPSASTGSEPGSDGETPSTSPLGAGYAFDISAETVHITQARKTFGPIIGRHQSAASGTDMTRGAGDNDVTSPILAAQPDLVGRTLRLAGMASGWRPGDYTITAATIETDTVTLDQQPASEGAANGERWTLLATQVARREGASLALAGAVNKVTPFPDGVSVSDVGKTLWITSGPAGWRLGPYLIRDVADNAWYLDRGAARAGAIGGASWVIPASPLPAVARKYDYKGAIGVNADRIEGCDVFRSKFEWTRTVQVANLSRAYLLVLRNLVGRKNASHFYGSPPGDVLYIGATGTFSVSDRWSVTHRFAEIEGRADIEIVPNELRVPYKRGWDYLWVKYERRPDAGTIAPRAAAAYVEEVYEDGDFSLIGIGV